MPATQEYPLKVGTGKVTLQYERVFGNSSIGSLKIDPKIARLATGKLELDVADAPPAVTIKDVTLTDVDEAAGTISVSFGRKDSPTKLVNVPLVVGVRVVASHVLPGSANNLPFEWEYLNRLKGKVVSIRVRTSATGMAVVSVASGND
jgi:hypothetical protein